MKIVKFVGFKADGEAHRLWQRLYLFEENKDYLIFAASFPSITETNGRNWSNNEPTLYFCPKNRFFNVIIMFKESGDLVYYVNIASPVVQITDDEYGFIDLDLDVKLLQDKSIKLLDADEFADNSSRYNYSENLIKICWQTVEEVKELMRDGGRPFDDDVNRNILKRFVEERHR